MNRLETMSVCENIGERFYKAAYGGDLQKVLDLVEEEKLEACHEWKVNPVRGMIEGSGRCRIAEVLLRTQGPDLLLLQARCPDDGNTLLHLAAHLKKEKLAIFLINSLAHDCPHRQRFLEAVNHAGETALHIATQNLLTLVVKKFTLEAQLKINIKDTSGQTAFDVIANQCHKCTLRDDWKTPWRISIMLRCARAKRASKLEKYEDEEDTMKEMTAIESLIMNEESWRTTTNTILIVATLALTLIFAAIFTIPQTLAPGGGGGGGGGGIL